MASNKDSEYYTDSHGASSFSSDLYTSSDDVVLRQDRYSMHESSSSIHPSGKGMPNINKYIPKLKKDKFLSSLYKTEETIHPLQSLLNAPVQSALGIKKMDTITLKRKGSTRSMASSEGDELDRKNTITHKLSRFLKSLRFIFMFFIAISVASGILVSIFVSNQVGFPSFFNLVIGLCYKTSDVLARGVYIEMLKTVTMTSNPPYPTVNDMAPQAFLKAAQNIKLYKGASYVLDGNGFVLANIGLPISEGGNEIGVLYRDHSNAYLRDGATSVFQAFKSFRNIPEVAELGPPCITRPAQSMILSTASATGPLNDQLTVYIITTFTPFTHGLLLFSNSAFNVIIPAIIAVGLSVMFLLTLLIEFVVERHIRNMTKFTATVCDPNQSHMKNNLFYQGASMNNHNVLESGTLTDSSQENEDDDTDDEDIKESSKTKNVALKEIKNVNNNTTITSSTAQLMKGSKNINSNSLASDRTRTFKESLKDNTLQDIRTIIRWFRRTKNRIARYFEPPTEIRDARNHLLITLRTVKNAIPYLSSKQLRSLSDENKTADTTSERVEATMLCCELSNYSEVITTMKENRTDLHRLFVNNFLEESALSIEIELGIPDKTVGGCVITGAFLANKTGPFHAARSIHSSFIFEARCDIMNKEWMKQKVEPIQIVFGFHTGPVTMGVSGMGLRANTVFFGTVVHDATQIKALNRKYGTSRICTGAVYDTIKNIFVCRYLEKIMVEDTEQPIDIYEIVGYKSLPDQNLDLINLLREEAFVSPERQLMIAKYNNTTQLAMIGGNLNWIRAKEEYIEYKKECAQQGITDVACQLMIDQCEKWIEDSNEN